MLPSACTPRDKSRADSCSAPSASSGLPSRPRRHTLAAAGVLPCCAPWKTDFRTLTPPARSIRRLWRGKYSGTSCWRPPPYGQSPRPWSFCSPALKTAGRRPLKYAFWMADLRLSSRWHALPSRFGMHATLITDISNKRKRRMENKPPRFRRRKPRRSKSAGVRNWMDALRKP